MRLYDLAGVIRSKNAGPFTLTIDLLFRRPEDLEQVLAAPAFRAEPIAVLYGVPADSVRIHAFRRVRAIKVSMPRPQGCSGAADDTDVYGSQQHFPLAQLEIPGQP